MNIVEKLSAFIHEGSDGMDKNEIYKLIYELEKVAKK